jgi:Rv0078B-related antitoxin
MDPKPRPNHRRYLEILRGMTVEQKLQKVVELSEIGNSLFRAGLRKRFPDATEEELHRIYLERLEKCHNRNY